MKNIVCTSITAIVDTNVYQSKIKVRTKNTISWSRYFLDKITIYSAYLYGFNINSIKFHIFHINTCNCPCHVDNFPSCSKVQKFWIFTNFLGNIRNMEVNWTISNFRLEISGIISKVYWIPYSNSKQVVLFGSFS